MNAEDLAEKIVEFWKDLDCPQPPCEFCMWYKLKTPTGRPTKEAKKHCYWAPQYKDSYHDCKGGIIKYLNSEVKEDEC